MGDVGRLFSHEIFNPFLAKFVVQCGGRRQVNNRPAFGTTIPVAVLLHVVAIDVKYRASPL